jgi:N-acyl-L-homoserine lactone synthetase
MGRRVKASEADMLTGAFADNETGTNDIDEGFTQGIVIQEAGFVVKNLVSDDERIQAHRLRHRVYCEELGWVPRSETLLEIDAYDRHTVFIGVLDQHQTLLASCRLHLPGTAFMIEREFSSLVGAWHKIRKHNDTAEVSRSCVAQEARRVVVRRGSGIYRLSTLVYKGVYHWCSMNGIRYVYIVVEDKLYRMLRAMGFQSHLVGAPVTMPDGCVAMAAVVDWKEFVSGNTVKRPDFAKWFTLDESGRFEEPRRQPEFCSQPEASP